MISHMHTHRVVKELTGTVFNVVDYIDAAVEVDPGRVYFENQGTTGPKGFRGHNADGSKQVGSHWSIQIGARCVKRCTMGFDQEDWKSMRDNLREAAQKVGINKIGQRMLVLEAEGAEKRCSFVGSMGSVSICCVEDMISNRGRRSGGQFDVVVPERSRWRRLKKGLISVRCVV